MFKENEAYNKLIRRQITAYLKNQELIQNRVNRILSECNIHYIIGNERERKQKIQQLGAKNLINIGGGGFIFQSKKNKFNNSMKITDILQQRNLRLNFYGALYNGLCDYEYCEGLTPLRYILRDIGVKHHITRDDYFKFDDIYNIEPEIFNYTVDLYNFKNDPN